MVLENNRNWNRCMNSLHHILSSLFWFLLKYYKND
ncbi:unnamed protein product [Onchocerca flexuosa]|uniref:Uncharacterized protein n=1 Tax=Onchocerca flexuosa TaxID=387005 RepID=A0A183HHE0_9BILA|nr:unnamed protein product [Onchocerca flexuosa]